MMIANYAVWPVAHLINFKFVPSQQRILYINCCQARRRSAAVLSFHLFSSLVVPRAERRAMAWTCFNA